MTERQKFILPVGRFAWPSLAEPNDDPDFGSGKYECTLLIDKEVFKKDKACMAMYKHVMQICKDEDLKAGKGKAAKVVTKLSQFPEGKCFIKDGDLIAEEKGWDGYAGCYAITAKNNQEVPVVDGDKDRMDSKDIARIKGGDHGRIIVTPAFYHQGPGVTSFLDVVQYWKAGEAFGSNSDSLIDGLDTLETPLEEIETDEPEVDLDEEDEEAEEEPKKKPTKRKAAAKPKAKAKRKAKPKVEPEEEEIDDEDDEDGVDLDDL